MWNLKTREGEGTRKNWRRFVFTRKGTRSRMDSHIRPEDFAKGGERTEGCYRREDAAGGEKSHYLAHWGENYEIA